MNTIFSDFFKVMTRRGFALNLGLLLLSFSHYTRCGGQETWAVEYSGDEETLRQILANCSVKYLFNNYYQVSADLQQEDVETFHNFLLSHHEFLWVEREESEEHDVAIPVPVEFPAAQVYSAPLKINDPNWTQQWYLHNETGGIDMNVTGAWDKGYTGANVKVAVIDSGIRNNSELTQRMIGFLEVLQNDSSPYEGFSHGTSVAGVIAGERNNGFCGTGIAPKANILGIKIFPNSGGGSSKPSDEATALQANTGTVDIYHNSWTAASTGAHITTPSKLVAEAVEKGVKQGRGGRGSIYVWSAGNGGPYDGCAYDGYLNHPYAIVVTGVTKNLQRLGTGERCPAVMVTAFSSDVTAAEKNPIVAPDGDSGCTDAFGRSSAASPMVSGAVALALEANPSLTYRDVMHILVRTSHIHVFTGSPHYDFIQNAAKRYVSPSFGFGLLDIGGVVSLAETWVGKDVKARTTCHMLVFENKSIPLPQTPSITFPVPAGNCSIVSLEHVEVTIKATFRFRGDLKVSLRSPGLTETDILSGRPMDFFRDNLDLKVMALTFWDEEATGNWKFAFADKSGDNRNDKGEVTSLSLTLYGQGDGSDKSSGPYITKFPPRPPPVEKTNHGLIAGIVVGSVGGVLIVSLSIFFVLIKVRGVRKRRVSGSKTNTA